MKRIIIPAFALALSACGGGGTATPDASGTTDTPIGIAAPAVSRDEFAAETIFSVGDTVINCPTGETLTVLAVASDDTAQLTGGHWYAYADLTYNGPPYTCDGQRRPAPPTLPADL